ncbi:hypothetical protein [Roseicella aerolata]|uniref:Uncharacterized protein n=1 Tax=Roseicella aerolata TaxID=2883479 RepID=A0A9X1IKL2_9PROT|nr:hypothetical protein [Roseicella aerolata]MCB4825348.1 hypothetical protein [Roseicella aerolata]
MTSPSNHGPPAFQPLAGHIFLEVTMFNHTHSDIEDQASCLDPILHLATLVEHARMEKLLRHAHQPELAGTGVSYFDDPLARLEKSARLLEERDTANAVDCHQGALSHYEDPCKPHPLHGAVGGSLTETQGARVCAASTQAQKSADLCDFFVLGLDPAQCVGGAAVHPLVKEERNNGRTDRSFDLTAGAMHRASSGNSASAIRLVGSAHRDNHASTASRSAQLVLREGALRLSEGNPDGDRSVIPLHGAEDAHPAEPAASPPTTASAPAECPFDYLRFDYFDNGAPSANGKKQRARHVVNVFATAHGSRSRGADYRISFLSEARFFKRSVPSEVPGGMQDDFYRRIWAKYEELRDSPELKELGVQVYIGHWKDGENHVVPHAAAILVRAPGQFPVLAVRYGSWRQDVDIDKPARGTKKCRNLIGLGYASVPVKREMRQRPTGAGAI